jgi:hypothetical protein
VVVEALTSVLEMLVVEVLVVLVLPQQRHHLIQEPWIVGLVVMVDKFLPHFYQQMHHLLCKLL